MQNTAKWHCIQSVEAYGTPMGYIRLHMVTLGYNIFGLLMFSGLPMPVLPSNALQSVQSFAPAAQTH
jgi:hypothetical protein